MSSCGRIGVTASACRQVVLANIKRLFRDPNGTTAVEFGLVFPVFLLVLVGTFEFGRSLEARNDVSRALSQAVRVVNLDPDQPPEAIAELVATYLDEYTAEDLTISVSATTVAGIDYMDISVSFPFEVIIPFSDTSSLTLNVDTRAPIVGPLH